MRIVNLSFLALTAALGCAPKTPGAKSAHQGDPNAPVPARGDAALMHNPLAGVPGERMGSRAGGVHAGGGLFVSGEIANACGLDAVGTPPKFAFDSSAINESDRPVLLQLAVCLTEGTLRGKSISLVGHTDAVGESEFNMSLGEMRADAIRRYLHDLGVGEDRMLASSRGEMDATGSDDSGRQFDRRVDIVLAN